MILPINPGHFLFEKGVFRPERGSGRLVGSPPDWRSEPLAAGIIVGLAPGKSDKVATEAMTDLVRRKRTDGVGEEEVPLYLQVGTYQHREAGEAVTERALRAFVFCRPSEPTESFEASILNLSEEACTTFAQPEVIVEFQRRGLSVKVWGMRP